MCMCSQDAMSEYHYLLIKTQLYQGLLICFDISTFLKIQHSLKLIRNNKVLTISSTIPIYA